MNWDETRGHGTVWTTCLEKMKELASHTTTHSTKISSEKRNLNVPVLVPAAHQALQDPRETQVLSGTFPCLDPLDLMETRDLMARMVRMVLLEALGNQVTASWAE